MVLAQGLAQRIPMLIVPDRMFELLTFSVLFTSGGQIMQQFAYPDVLLTGQLQMSTYLLKLVGMSDINT